VFVEMLNLRMKSKSKRLNFGIDFQNSNEMKKIILLVLLLSLFGCVPSLVYSPSVNLPPRPLQKEKTQVIGGAGLFPETRPDMVPHKLAIGSEATLRHAFSDRFSLQFETWIDLSNNVEQFRWGLSSAGIIALNDSSDYRIGIMPVGAICLDGQSIEGGGIFIPATLWINNLDPFFIYAATGPAIGLRDLSEGKNQWGWGIITNIGFGILINNEWTINLEFAGIRQASEFNHRTDDFFSPSLNVGYIF
jgi:hypothetical protein